MTENLPALTDTGLLRPRNLNEAIEQAKIYVQSGMLPERYKTVSSVLVAMQFALELGLRPLTALRQIAVVQGTPTVFGDLPLSMVYASGKIESIEEIFLDDTGTAITVANKNLSKKVSAAVCIVKRKGDPLPLEAFFTMQEATEAKLLSNPTWQKYPKRMLRYRARSQALKDKFPDVLNGISIAEYDHHIVLEDLPSAPNGMPPIPVHPEPETSPDTSPDTKDQPPKKPKVPLSEKLLKKVESPEVIEAEIE